MTARRIVAITSILCVNAGIAAQSPAPVSIQATEPINPSEASVTFHLDRSALSTVVESNRSFMVRSLPLITERTVDLELQQFSITGPHTRFVLGHVGAADTLLDFDPSSVVLLRGNVVGKPGSHVFLALSNSTTQGWITLGDGGEKFTLRGRPTADDASSHEIIVLPMQVQTTSSYAPLCGVADDFFKSSRENPVGIAQLPLAVGASGGINQIELAIETDFEYFELFNDSDEAAAYIVQLYGAMADIFIRDVNSTVTISFVRLWDTPQDMFNEQNPLSPFAAFWSMNMGAVSRDVAQFLSGRRDMPFGGVAFLNTLCNTISGYSVAGYIAGSFSASSYRDVVVTSHELGHNVAAQHTHSLGLDTCNNPLTPPQRGPIMSYCGQTFTGGYANIDLRFRVESSAVMQVAMAIDLCLASDCNLNGIDDQQDIFNLISLDANGDGVPDECQDCNNNGLFDDDEIASGFSRDANTNGVPDECEPDCNGNGLPDDVDISTGTSLDLFGNGVPDECETDGNANAISDYTEIQSDMSLDLDRNAVLDALQDCDNDSVADLTELAGANAVWVADQLQTSMRKYLFPVGTESGQSINAGLQFPQDVLILNNSRILVSSRDDNRVVQFGTTGQLIGDLIPSAAPGAGALNQPATMLLTPAGDLLIANTGDHNVLRYDLKGQFIGQFVVTASGGLTLPFGMTYGPDNQLYVTSSDNQVLRYDGASGAFLDVFVSNTDNGGLLNPRGIVFLPSGDLLIASFGSNAVLRYDGTTGAFIEKFNRNGTDSVLTLDQPWAIRIGPDGGVYVSLAHNEPPLPAEAPDQLHLTDARIYHFDPSNGNFIRAFVQGADSNLEHVTGFDFIPGFNADCNFNLRPDSCDISDGSSLDLNQNGVPDECETPGDVNGDGPVNVLDLLELLGDWGACALPCPPFCSPADLDHNCAVDVEDLLMLLVNWS